MKRKLPNRVYRSQYLALVLFGAFVLLLNIGLKFYQNQSDVQPLDIEFIQNQPAQGPLILTEFNPNDFDEKQWQQLGFSENQVRTILNYKKVVGGSFKSKEQLKKCYGIPPETFAQLAPYILLPETNYDAHSGNFSYKTFKKDLKIPGKFNPDLYTSAQWQHLGFTENQANAILKYKNYLGGSFVSKEKFKECFIISDENYHKLAPYLILPDKTPENFRNYTKNYYPEKTKPILKPFDPNLLDAAGWMSLGFSEKQTSVIMNYRDRNLRGSFKSLEDIQRCFVINAEKFEELRPFIRLNPENFKINPNPNAVGGSSAPGTRSDPAAEERTDFSKVDLNQITFRQLKAFGFTDKDAAMLLSFRKKLGGFVNKSQVLETYEIDQALAQKLMLTATLNNAGVQKYSLTDAPEEWLKNHPYFKYSADKIIFYRITNPNENKIWKFLKLKPEYEAKMRLYLK